MFIYDFFKKCFDRGPQFGSKESFRSNLSRLQFTFLEEFLWWCWTTKRALECRDWIIVLSDLVRNTPVLWEVRERERERERERSNLIRFYGSTCILLEQLVSTWSENVYFTHFYQMFSNNSDGRMLKYIYIWFYIQGMTPTPLRLNPHPSLLEKKKLYAFSRLDQSENIIDRFRSVGLRKLHKKGNF